MIANRRQLLQLGLAASLLPAAARAASFEPGAPAGRAPLYRILYDTRYPASAAFAERAAARGSSIAAMSGDVTRFWYDDLYHRWKRGPAPIAGLTAYGALFCLERLAWDQRMRVVFRAEHEAVAGGRVAHRLDAPSSLLPGAAAAAVSPDWAARLAEVVTMWSGEHGARSSTTAVTAEAGATPVSEPLFTWVIAPAART